MDGAAARGSAAGRRCPRRPAPAAPRAAPLRRLGQVGGDPAERLGQVHLADPARRARGGRRRAGAVGDADLERAARAGRAAHRDRAAVQRDQLVHEREPDAGALAGAPDRALHAVEPPEQQGNVVGRDADAGVPTDIGTSSVPPVRRRVIGAVEGELERVGEQVQHDPLPHLPVHGDHPGQRRAVHDELEPATLDRRRERGGDRAGQLAELGGHGLGAQAAAGDLGEVEDVVEQPAQARGVAADQPDALALARVAAARRCRRAPPRPARRRGSAGCAARGWRWRTGRSWRGRGRTVPRCCAAPPRGGRRCRSRWRSWRRRGRGTRGARRPRR